MATRRRVKAKPARKNAAAAALARKKWAGMSRAARSAAARLAINARWEQYRAAREAEGKK